MKKVKELGWFLLAFFVPLVLIGVAAVAFPKTPSFVGYEHYIRLFLKDQIFLKSLLNTVLIPLITAFLVVTVFAAVMYVLSKKKSVSRRWFYIGGAALGSVASLLCRSIMDGMIALYPAESYDTSTLVLNITSLPTAQMGAMTLFNNAMLSLSIGALAAFIFWIFECIGVVVRNIKKRLRS